VIAMVLRDNITAKTEKRWTWLWSCWQVKLFV